ncbi:four helix bundle protein [Citrobacter portucalensis]|uniref:four helix bundle protein n=1 Tax=Citrobacter portucalensis TaxID=1639133 RepID=UPI001F3F0406|nr:four helix bundle protein [Citrobacter portucalensis]
MKVTFKQPKVYDDLLQLYRSYWNIHKHLPKPFRMTTGEMILHEISGCIKRVILANYVDKKITVQREKAAGYLESVRADLVVIRGLLTVGWNMMFISHGNFMVLTTKLDEIEKQITRWHSWFLAGVDG